MQEFQQYAKSQLLAQQKTQNLYFNRGAKSLPHVKTGDTVRMKTKNGFKPATVTKPAHSYKTCSQPPFSNGDQQWNSRQAKQEKHNQDPGSKQRHHHESKK